MGVGVAPEESVTNPESETPVTAVAVSVGTVEEATEEGATTSETGPGPSPTPIETKARSRVPPSDAEVSIHSRGVE